MIQDDLEACIRRSLNPSGLRVRDDSSAHAGHAGAKAGAHFTVEVVSDKFENLSRVARHRLVYHSCAELMPSRIHALAIVALTPSEALQTNKPAPG
ncbi:MAG: BolA family protein [Burkholderiaceae bacterium]